MCVPMSSVLRLRAMPPEPWGWRMKRAREGVAGLTLDEATFLVGHWMLTTKSTIARLERHPVVPVGPRTRAQRQLAYVLCLCYEIDPAEFDLGPGDLPPGLRIPPRHHGRDGTPSVTRWYVTAA